MKDNKKWMFNSTELRFLCRSTFESISVYYDLWSCLGYSLWPLIQVLHCTAFSSTMQVLWNVALWTYSFWHLTKHKTIVTKLFWKSVDFYFVPFSWFKSERSHRNYMTIEVFYLCKFPHHLLVCTSVELRDHRDQHFHRQATMASVLNPLPCTSLCYNKTTEINTNIAEKRKETKEWHFKDRKVL